MRVWIRCLRVLLNLVASAGNERTVEMLYSGRRGRNVLQRYILIWTAKTATSPPAQLSETNVRTIEALDRATCDIIRFRDPALVWRMLHLLHIPDRFHIGKGQYKTGKECFIPPPWRLYLYRIARQNLRCNLDFLRCDSRRSVRLLMPSAVTALCREVARCAQFAARFSRINDAFELALLN